MYEVYNESMYNVYIKNLRKSRNLSLIELSKIVPFSSGTLSLFENCTNILCSDKLDEILRFYNLDANTLIQFDQKLSILMNEYVNNVIYINKELSSKYKNLIIDLLLPFKDTLLFSIYYIVELLDQTHNDNRFETLSFDLIVNSIKFLSPKFQALASSYLAMAHVHKKQFDKAKQYFNESSYYLTKDDTYADMYYYGIASYYIYINDIPNSIVSCEKAISLFTKSQNFKRLTNTNIIIANQYLQLKDYNRSMQINKDVLESAKIHDNLINQRTALNNLGFIYMMKADFSNACKCYELIPKSTIKDRHLYSYTICLGEVDNFETGITISATGLSMTVTPYYKYMFKIYNDYFQDKNLKKLAKNIEKAFDKFDDYLDNFEKEFLCVLLGNQYKRLGNIKKALEYYEKLHKLNYTS